jgi:abortive infection bacteriophage resistance protein
MDIKIVAESVAIDEMIERIQAICDEPASRWELSQQQRQHLSDDDDLVVRLEQVIQKTFFGCFRTNADLGPLSMLERIETEMNRMILLCEKVAPDFLAYKQTMRERERREQQRKEWQEKRAREQQRKMEQAIARAKEPMPRRTNRPVNSKVLPIKVIKKNNELLQRRRREQAEEHRLLYQEDD